MSNVQLSVLVRTAAAVFGPVTPEATTALSQTYRDQPGRAVLLSESGKRAYLAARLPATYAAILRALQHYRAAGGPVPDTVLDAGCGPGTASLAAASVFPELTAVTRNDLDATWRPVVDALGLASAHPALTSARWLTGAMSETLYPIHDMVVAAYALNEVAVDARPAAVRALWAAARHALVLVEPGTPAGFLAIQSARDSLLRAGAFVVAPCTHQAQCPMTERDWCHSAVRLPRDAAHRGAKGAALAYEDEKFAYLAVTRKAAGAQTGARIVKKPALHSGHVRLDLCGATGLIRQTVSRRDGALYKTARKTDWGDRWPPD